MPSLDHFASSLSRKGFTLLELLVAMAVLIMISVALLSITSSASSTISASDSQRETAAQARQALSRIGADITAQLRRNDIYYGYPPAVTNTSSELAFYTEAASYNGNRKVSLVRYRVNPGTHGLERGVLGLSWADPSQFFLPAGQSGTISNQIPSVPDADFQILSPQIFRFEVCYLSVDESTGNSLLATTPPAKIQDLRALVVGIAALDERSFKIITPAQVEGIAAKLPHPAANQDPVTCWEGQLGSPNFAAGAGIPQSVAGKIRFYQRYFPVK